MKLRTALRTLATAFVVLFSFHLFAQNEKSKMVEVIFKPSMDKAELMRIKEAVKLQGVQLDYEHLDMKDGRLVGLSIAVTTDKGTGKATMPELRADSHFGFRYDPTPGGHVPFSVGSMAPSAAIPGTQGK